MRRSADVTMMTDDAMTMIGDVTMTTVDVTTTGNGIVTTVIAIMIATMTIAEEGETYELRFVCSTSFAHLDDSEGSKEKKHSHAGTRTRVGEVKTRYPNRLDYMGLIAHSFLSPFTT